MRARNLFLGFVVGGLTLLSGRSGTADEPAPLFPFVLPWDDATPGATDMSGLLDKPAGKAGPVQVRDGHFFAGDRRLRLFGVNLCFGSSFPSHEEAEKVAARMAKYGINCVRFHHMETSTAPNGLVKADRKTLDPERLERLDYLIAQLKAHGVYANLNLHVGRAYPDRPKWADMPSYFKGVDNFDAAMIRSQMQYARDLLHHVNPYTKTRYADEPAVAIVEINNENALFNEWSGGGLEQMPDPYAADLRGRWNKFLADRYMDDAALKAAWQVREEPRGQELLANGTFAQGLAGWNLEKHSGKATAETAKGPEGPLVRVKVEEPAKESWHVQLGHAGLKLAKDRPYTLRFRARSDAPASLGVNAMQAHEPWRQHWTTQVQTRPEWQTFEFVFGAHEADANGRITFSGMGTRAGTVELADVSLVPGGVYGLKPGEGLGSIGWFTKADYGARTPEAQADWVRFLWGVEEWYWTGMYRFVKQDLGVKAVVLGTQMGWSPPPIQAKLDAVDSHSYWQHPHFPKRPWDAADWTIQNIPMAGRPDGGTLPRLGLSRVVGKPFLCTEYNHSAPNTYGAEGFPLLAAYAARQDWDGVFVFAYSHRGGEWDAGRITSFFDIDQHPTKMATLPAAVAMFVRGDVPRAAQSVVVRPKPEEWIEAGRKGGAWGLRADAFGVDPAAALRAFVGIALDEKSMPAATGSAGPEDAAAFAWKSGPGTTGAVSIDTPRSKAYIGSTRGGAIALRDLTIVPGPNRQDWAAFTATAIDGVDFRSPGRIVLTATGLAENEGMKWTDAEKRSVGRDWGQAPSLVEGIPATIELNVPANRVKAWPLDERGQRRTDAALAVVANGAGCRIAIGPEARTLWYEVEIDAEGR